MIDINVFSVGVMGTNAYVITDKTTGDTAVVDPGAVDSRLTAFLDSVSKDKIKYILLTHGHFDHIGGALYYSEKYDAKIVISREDKPFLSDNTLNLSALFSRPLEAFSADILLSDGDRFRLGDTEVNFLLTPGHTMGSGCYVLSDDKIIFSGDTLFYRSMGRVDFPTGDPFEMKKSLNKLCSLEGDYKVYPGHDISTTLQGERDNNPYL